MNHTQGGTRYGAPDILSGLALFIMLALPLQEMIGRKIGVNFSGNPMTVVQHLGLLLAMAGSYAGIRDGETFAISNGAWAHKLPHFGAALKTLSVIAGVMICGALVKSGYGLVAVEIEGGATLSYGIPRWCAQAILPLGFLALAYRLARSGTTTWWATLGCLLAGGLLWALAWHFLPETAPPLLVWIIALALPLGAALGLPMATILGAAALLLFWSQGQPIEAVETSHYQLTGNPTLPSIPLFTLAGFVLSQGGAGQRLTHLFAAIAGANRKKAAIGAAMLCAFFTAFTGGSGVTILAIGGIILPFLKQTGMPESAGIRLIASGSALGVLIAPSAALLLIAIVAKIPINDMMLSGVFPAIIMATALLVGGRFFAESPDQAPPPLPRQSIGRLAWEARWELCLPVVTLGALGSGITTPTEAAALTAAYALLIELVFKRTLSARGLITAVSGCAKSIGGVLLMLGMALALTGFLVDAGIPTLLIDFARSHLPGQWAFILTLSAFLLLAGTMMDIFSATVVLVPILLPVAVAFNMSPLHFGIVFLAHMEIGFLLPPIGMNIYFSAARFGKPVTEIAKIVLPAVFALVVGAQIIAWFPQLALWLPQLFK